MSKMSFHCRVSSMAAAKSSAEKMETTWTEAANGQYSAIGVIPAGYCQAARRARPASRSTLDTLERNVRNATKSMGFQSESGRRAGAQSSVDRRLSHQRHA